MERGRKQNCGTLCTLTSVIWAHGPDRFFEVTSTYFIASDLAPNSSVKHLCLRGTGRLGRLNLTSRHRAMAEGGWFVASATMAFRVGVAAIDLLSHPPHLQQ